MQKKLRVVLLHTQRTRTHGLNQILNINKGFKTWDLTWTWMEKRWIWTCKRRLVSILFTFLQFFILEMPRSMRASLNAAAMSHWPYEISTSQQQIPSTPNIINGQKHLRVWVSWPAPRIASAKIHHSKIPVRFVATQNEEKLSFCK